MLSSGSALFSKVLKGKRVNIEIKIWLFMHYLLPGSKGDYEKKRANALKNNISSLLSYKFNDIFT